MEKSKRGMAFTHSLFAVGLGVLGLLQTPVAGAVSFELGGDITGAFDTDITYGYQRRTAGANFNATPGNGSTRQTVSASYGNRVLFPEAGDTISNAIRVSHALELKRGDTGFLMHGNYFYDAAFRGKNLPTDTRNSLLHAEDITDAFIYTKLGNNFTLRVGQQIINWGENTFIQGGISDINTFDIGKLRVPGADLKDAFIGTKAIDLAWSEDNLSIEGFALFRYDQARLDPMGSPFSTQDAAVGGGGFDLGGNGVPGGGCVSAGTPAGRCDIFGGGLVRTSDQRARKNGQWGIAIRKFFPDFFSGGEVALYAQNLHDHLPSVSTYARTGLFFIENPKDIKRYGISFNTTVAALAVSGEWSIRKGAPIQLIKPLSNGLVGAVGPFAPDLTIPVGTYQQGWAKADRQQLQVTVQKNWGVVHQLGADGGSSIIEMAVGKVNKLPAANQLFEPTLTHSWSGFQMRHSLLYQAALFNLVAMTPNFAYRWDLRGNSNEFGGGKAFVAGRRAATLGLDFDYMSGRYKGGIGYTNFFGKNSDKNVGNGLLNGTVDRDFIQANVSISF